MEMLELFWLSYNVGVEGEHKLMIELLRRMKLCMRKKTLKILAKRECHREVDECKPWSWDDIKNFNFNDKATGFLKTERWWE